MHKSDYEKILLAAGLLFNLALSAALPPNVPSSGLVGWWPLDATGNDLGPNANNGTVHGATPVNDRFNLSNHAYSFDGSSNYILVPNAPSLSGFTDLTISVWAKTTMLSGTQCMVAKWWQFLNPGGSSDTYEAAMENGHVNFATNINNFGLSAPPALSSNVVDAWTHFVFVYNSSSATSSIYMNGSVLYSESITGSGICNSVNDLYFGADVDGQHFTPPMLYRFFSGALDDIGMWNRALTENEILALYAPVTTGLTQQSSSGRQFGMGQNSPNPFSQETTISYNLPQQVKNASVVIYNLHGEKVSSIPLTQRGEASVTLSAEVLASGIYAYSIIADDKKIVDSKRMIVTGK